MMTNDYEAIKEYVYEHYAHFGAYPMEIETDTQVYTFDQYWAILDAGDGLEMLKRNINNPAQSDAAKKKMRDSIAQLQREESDDD